MWTPSPSCDNDIIKGFHRSGGSPLFIQRIDSVQTQQLHGPAIQIGLQQTVGNQVRQLSRGIGSNGIGVEHHGQAIVIEYQALIRPVAHGVLIVFEEGPGYCIKGEFAANGVPNDLRHTRGVLSMARAQAMDSAGSQFFIMHKDAPHLDGQYAAFGMVIDGMDVVDEIVSQPRNMITNKPKKPQVMKSVTVDTQGVEYPEPGKLPDPFHK